VVEIYKEFIIQTVIAFEHINNFMSK